MSRAKPGLLIPSNFLLLWLLWSCSAASGRPRCHVEERSALLGFKNSFFNEPNCFYYGGKPWKMMSWKVEEGKAGDCCDWGGVTCDEGDGHVIGLDLSASCLAGRLDYEASVFDLVHLQELDLSHNSFHGSQMPTAMGRLTRLKRLNLSSCGFVGTVVPEMLRLLNLSSLDLSKNTEMNIFGLEEWLPRLNKIEELDLSHVAISDGKVPRSLGNMTSLRSLVLHGCGLSGEFPDSVFTLPRLEFIDVGWNYGLMGRLTGFNRGSRIKSLKLSETNFTGELPVQLGNLSYLTEIDIHSCGLWGGIPSSIGDLTKLEYLNLEANKFHGPIPSTFKNLTYLIVLNLSENQLSGEIPSSLTQLPQLSQLLLSSNILTGNIPSRIGNLTHLTVLDLSSNELHGSLPGSIYQIRNLSDLFLSSNYLIGVARLDMLLELKALIQIDLSYNTFSSIIFPEPNASISEIEYLCLDSCNLMEVPGFLRSQRRLRSLQLSKNNISGEIPEWLLQKELFMLDMSFNYIQGTLPIPPNPIAFYLVSNNRLSGELPSLICELEFILILDLADNHFTGLLPPCLGKLSLTLFAMSFRGNDFSGKIPDLYNKQCRLRTMDLSSNSFEGPVPRSLTNCSRLTYVNFGRNKIMDTFPSWLGSLPLLKVLMLHSNKLHGLMMAPQNNSWFPGLKVIALSENNLGGKLPADFLASWQAMKHFSPDDDTYPDSYTRMISMTIIDKGIEREFGNTLGYFTMVDLSSNNFSGIIPESIGDNLLKLHTLNLSNNDLSGQIPLSLANLKNLEVLDLSRNRLSGEIPGMLARITTLNHLNVSYNNLSGSIPLTNQFGTFENASYIGNPELCGFPLTKKCGNPPQSPPSQAHDQEEKSSFPLGIVWITALVGLAGGLIVGVALEQAFGADVLYWLARKWRKYRTSTT